MKILILNASDVYGGAAIAAYRLHRSLIEEGADSLMLVQNKYSDDSTVMGPLTNLDKVIARARYFFDQFPVKKYKNRTKTLFSPSWFPFNSILKKINQIKPDIVHLHWICDGMLRIEDILKINQPIVWSLHDMWPFTGGCHYNEGCERYNEKCGKCKVLGSNIEKDLSRRVWLRKEKVFSQKNNLYIVSLSNWLRTLAEKSYLFSGRKHIVIHNPIDTNLFKPFDKKRSRELWNLPENKSILLFGAMSATTDPRKGFKELIEALYKLPDKEKVEVVIFGNETLKGNLGFGIKTHCLGRLSDNVSLRTIYSACDVVVVPSLQENLSNTIMESLACGTPVVAFDVGGNRDMIDHKENGYLAVPFDTTDLKNGIEWVLNSQNYEEISRKARDKIVNEFNSKIIVKKYIELYKEILNEAK
ncbi:MAG: glycosyltransferase family 4 protein [Elusimicrobiota bacterium]